MLEYVQFDFLAFTSVSTRVHSLDSFLSHLDTRLIPDCCCKFSFVSSPVEDVAKGLEYLHESCIHNRDLETANVLVSSTHYCNIEDKETLLTYFGESRYDDIQTNFVASTRTNNVDQRTPCFMAREINVVKTVAADDLRRIDMWAYGMAAYCFLNPDANIPYYFDAKKAREK